jgi:sulfatase maturation enzyme AslB (radical SAM superfamily)
MLAARIGTWMRRVAVGTRADTSTEQADSVLSSPASPTPPPVIAPAPPRPDRHRGVINALSATHVEGWIQGLDRPEERIAYEVVLSQTNEVLARGIADQFRHGSHAAGVGDGAHSFLARLPRLLDEGERAGLVVRPIGGEEPLPRSPHLKTAFEPVLHVAMDIVDNCNLRCPFCLYDYSNTHNTHFMTDETIDAALRFLPYTRDGEFWFSCLHEPTLHPQFTRFIDKIPPTYRRKVFYTSNFAKRMPAAYFEWLADSAIHHVNLSIESLQPDLYERMRKGARHRIFRENWDALLTALEHGKAPPRLRYIAMVYKSNLAELPEMVRYLLQERNAWQVELRYTFDVPHLPPEFRASEFLDWGEWLALRDRLADFPRDRVQLILPPAPQPVAPVIAGTSPADLPAGAGDTPAQSVLRDYYLFRMSWDGSLRVVGVLANSRNDNGIETQLFETNVRDIADPAVFLDGIADRARSVGA